MRPAVELLAEMQLLSRAAYDQELRDLEARVKALRRLTRPRKK